jgi:hypothetical protein
MSATTVRPVLAGSVPGATVTCQKLGAPPATAELPLTGATNIGGAADAWGAKSSSPTMKHKDPTRERDVIGPFPVKERVTAVCLVDGTSITGL